LTVPFLDLTPQTQAVQYEVLERLRELMNENLFIGGETVSEFERYFAEYCGSAHCVALNSGTDALRFGLAAAGVGPEDEILTSPLTFIATVEAANQVGRVRFADVDPGTFNLSIREVEQKITKKTRALVPVDLYGLPADLPAFEKIARQRDLVVVEDACQAHGGAVTGRRTGSFGRCAAFSFYPTKNLSAFGDAGALTTSDRDLAERVRLLRNHGQTGPYRHESEGGNSRMDAFQAAVLTLKLPHLDRWNQERRKIAALYRQGIGDLAGFRLQDIPPGFHHVYHLFPLLVERREALQAFLESRQIQTRIIYPIPLHLMPALKHLGYRPGDFPYAEEICAKILCLPCYPGLGESQVEEVVAAIREFSQAGA